MRRDPRALLWDAHDAAEAVAGFIRGAHSRSISRIACCAPLSSVSARLSAKLSTGCPGLPPEIAARIPGLSQAVAFRNLLIHGDAVVDDAVVWRTVREDLPTLSLHLAALLAEPDSPG